MIGKRIKRDGVITTVARGHFSAMDYADVPRFIGPLQRQWTA